MEIKDKVLTTSDPLGKREGGEGSTDGHPHLLQQCKRKVMGGELESYPPKKNRGNLQLRVPVDILIEILSRIPVSDLIRFRLVCKLFYNLTRDRSLVDLHLERARRAIPPCVLIFTKPNLKANVSFSLLDNDWVHKYSFELPISRGYYCTTASCNGIICIYDDNGYVQLLNPTTREHLILPEPTRVEESCIYPKCYLGFHPGTEKYKILRHFSLHGDQPVLNSRFQFCLEVLTVGDGLWRRISDIDYIPSSDGVVINGIMFWLVDKTDSIVAIDLDDEKFVNVPLPDKEHAAYRSTFSAEVEGSACLAISRLVAPSVLDIWILKDLANHVWMQMYHIDIKKLFSLAPNWDWLYVTPMFFNRMKFLLGFRKFLCCFDLQCKEGSFEIIHRTGLLHAASIHVESLVSPRDL